VLFYSFGDISLTSWKVVGLYIEHVVLACLFFMRFNEEGTSAVVKASFMLALLAITAGAHIFISHCFSRKLSASSAYLLLVSD